MHNRDCRWLGYHGPSVLFVAIAFPFTPRLLMEPLLRRLQGELLLAGRQLDHVVTLLQEYCLFSSLYWSVRQGHVVGGVVEGNLEDEFDADAYPTTTKETANLLELETKSWALAYKVQTSVADIDSTMVSLARILGDMARLPAVISLGLDKVIVDICDKEMLRHRQLRQEAVTVVQIGQTGQLSIERLELLVTKLKLRVHWPDLVPILDAFVSTE